MVIFIYFLKYSWNWNAFVYNTAAFIFFNDSAYKQYSGTLEEFWLFSFSPVRIFDIVILTSLSNYEVSYDSSWNESWDTDRYNII